MLRQRPCRQLTIIAAAGILLLLFYHIYGQPPVDAGRPRVVAAKNSAAAAAAPSPQRHLFDSLHLDEKQCQSTFPGLTKDIDDMVALGPFPVKQARPDMGPLQIRLQKGRMYIVHKESDDMLSGGFLDARMAALHQIHRAVMTSPTPLPDTILSINVLDGPANETLSYSRPAFAAPIPGSPPVTRAFLMPHFAFWGWPALPFVGSFARAAEAVDALEGRLMPFDNKDPRPVWRGTKRYNSAQHPQMRTNLLEVAGDASWADVQELEWDSRGDDGGKKGKNTPVATNALPIEDFCRYKYILHTEGITYSGRLQFLQMCESVLLTPPMAWLQHTTHLVRPLFSGDIHSHPTWTPSTAEKAAWAHHPPSDANMVFVAPDWSDLHATVAWLEQHPDVARGIARRQRSLFVGGGYFSPAAEVCYWRALIRGWSAVAKTEHHDWESAPRGVPWELFAMGYKDGVAQKHN